jgi:hypothetical protein
MIHEKRDKCYSKQRNESTYIGTFREILGNFLKNIKFPNFSTYGHLFLWINQKQYVSQIIITNLTLNE